VFSLSFKLTGPECKISNFFPYTLNVHSSEFGRFVPGVDVANITVLIDGEQVNDEQ